MPDLLDLLEDWAPPADEWVPLYKPHGITLASVIVGDRCRDCGSKSGYNQGGSRQDVGIYMVCDDCAQLDACLTREHDRGPEWHVSHWGDVHRADEHGALMAAQARRRARYRAKHREG